MPRRIPKMCAHKGRAYMTLNGVQVQLGKEGSAEAQRNYNRNVAALMMGVGGTLDPAVREVMTELEAAMPKPEKRTPHHWRTCRVGQEIAKRFGDLPVSQFGPKALKRLRAHWAKTLARSTVNEYLVITKALFRQAVEDEIVPGEVLYRLQAVRGLKVGEEGVRETPAVACVALDVLEAVRADVPKAARAMLGLQLLTAMRPAEVRHLRLSEIDRSKPVWMFMPARHKTTRWGKVRIIPIGPQGQKLLEPWLAKLSRPTQYVFRPRGGETPYCGAYLNECIRRSCYMLGLPKFSANQVRHTAATAIRRKHGLEVAQLALGHSSRSTTEIYADPDTARLEEVFAQDG